MSESTFPTERIDPSEYLRQSGVLVEGEDDLVLAEPIRDRWAAELARVRAGGLDETDLRAPLAVVFETDPTHVTVEPVEESERISVLVDDDIVGQWVSLAGLAADTTASTVLASVDDGWAAIDPAQRGTVLSTLRIFVPSCPICGADVAFEERDCGCGCSGRSSYVFACEGADCGAVVYRIDKASVDAFL